MLKIATSTGDFYSSIRHLFMGKGEVSVVNLDRIRKTGEPLEVDLLIFPGGEDVNPQLYGSNYQTYYNSERDYLEASIYEQAITDSLIKAKKILGICRGHQLINVLSGGTLITDIEEFFGAEHSTVHAIRHMTKNHPFSWIQKVNSLHHQGLRTLSRGAQILSYEPHTTIPEIVVFDSRTLGFQFHPEFFDDSNPDKAHIVDVLIGWITDKIKFDVPARQQYQTIHVVNDTGNTNRTTSPFVGRFIEDIQQNSVLEEDDDEI